MDRKAKTVSKSKPDIRMRANVVVREDGRCFRCGKQVAIYEGETYHDLPVVKRVAEFSIHHRKPRGMGGSNSLDINIFPNLILLCGTGTTGCHGWVESHREQAYKEGLLIHSGIGNPIKNHPGKIFGKSHLVFLSFPKTPGRCRPSRGSPAWKPRFPRGSLEK